MKNHTLPAGENSPNQRIPTRRLALGALAATLVAVAAPAMADGPHGDGYHGGGYHGGYYHGGHPFYGRDYYGFNHREVEVWRGGGWQHDWHDGRYGWWWITGGYWYFYPEPIYPYPDYVPPAVIVQQAPPVPSGLPPMQTWYYCDNPQGYYPYVASCNNPWQQVPAQPPRQSAPPAQSEQPSPQ